MMNNGGKWKVHFSVNCRDDVENEEMLKQNSKVWESHVAQLHDAKHAYCLFEKKKKIPLDS